MLSELPFRLDKCTFLFFVLSAHSDSAPMALCSDVCQTCAGFGEGTAQHVALDANCHICGSISHFQDNAWQWVQDPSSGFWYRLCNRCCGLNIAPHLCRPSYHLQTLGVTVSSLAQMTNLEPTVREKTTKELLVVIARERMVDVTTKRRRIAPVGQNPVAAPSAEEVLRRRAVDIATWPAHTKEQQWRITKAMIDVHHEWLTLTAKAQK